MQFFDEETFKNFLGDYDFTTITLTVTDTYNEEAISHSIESLDKDVCLGIALQLAIVGYGNKKFNSVTVNGKQIDILEYMRNNGIKFDGRLNDKLKPGDLTPRRLIRFFRFATREYLMKNPHVQSYLFKKYAPLRSPSERITIFPGFEHLAERGTDDNAVEILVRTYAQLDARLKTNVKERIVRVLSARGFSYDRLITLQI